MQLQTEPRLYISDWEPSVSENQHCISVSANQDCLSVSENQDCISVTENQDCISVTENQDWGGGGGQGGQGWRRRGLWMCHNKIYLIASPGSAVF